MRGKRTLREIILSTKPGQEKKVKKDVLNAASLKQESTELNHEFRIMGIPLPDGVDTYFTVTAPFRDKYITIRNNQEPDKS